MIRTRWFVHALPKGPCANMPLHNWTYSVRKDGTVRWACLGCLAAIERRDHPKDNHLTK